MERSETCGLHVKMLTPASFGGVPPSLAALVKKQLLTNKSTMPIRLFIITLFAVSIFSGCSKEQRPAGFPPLFPCEITITQGNKPLEGALVQLVPESGTFQWTISGKTGSNGIAKLSTHAKFSGAPAGTFKVLVSKTEASLSKYPVPADDAPVEEWTEYRGLISMEHRPLIQYVKPEYEEVKMTPHSMTIVKGKNKAAFDVGEEVEIVLQ